MFSYNNELVDEKDQVRFLIQDRDENRPFFQDEEIEWVLTQEHNIYMAAAALCDTLIARSGGVKWKQISKLGIEYNTDFFVRLGATYRARGMSHQMPYIGGISAADKIALQGDTDWVRPTFSRELGDNPEAPSPSIGPPSSLTSI